MTWTTQDKVTVGVRFQMALRHQTQADLAKVIGVSQVSVSGRLNGRVRWSVDDLDALAAYYGIKVADLVEPQTPMPVDLELLAAQRTARRRLPNARLESVNAGERIPAQRDARRRSRVGGAVLIFPTAPLRSEVVAA